VPHAGAAVSRVRQQSTCICGCIAGATAINMHMRLCATAERQRAYAVDRLPCGRRLLVPPCCRSHRCTPARFAPHVTPPPGIARFPIAFASDLAFPSNPHLNRYRLTSTTTPPQVLYYDSTSPILRPPTPKVLYYDSTSPIARSPTPKVLYDDSTSPILRPPTPKVLYYDSTLPILRPPTSKVLYYDSTSLILRPPTPKVLYYDSTSPILRPPTPKVLYYDSTSPILRPPTSKVLYYDSTSLILRPPTFP